MSESSANPPEEKKENSSRIESSKKGPTSDSQILIFIILLCIVCGLLLAVFAYSLQGPQNEAKEFDQSKQMLIAAKILDPKGNFQIFQEDGSIVPAKFDATTKTLVPLPKNSPPVKAGEDEIKEMAALRIRPLLTDKEGTIFTFEEKNLTLPEYLSENKKAGYADLPLKLFYGILANSQESEKITAEELAKDIGKADIYVIPVSGFGLWAPIYGFIAIGPDGDTVIGSTWYEHGETPGLGANITEPWWQNQFYGKEIFQESPDGSTDFKSTTMGIIVVKGKVKDVYGNSPRSKSAVDGMSGATLTGDGVTQAYRNSLSPYRTFLQKVRETHVDSSQETSDKKSEENEEKDS